MLYRREFQRYIVQDSASLFTEDGKERLVMLKNLSGGGACVCGSYPFRANELVNVSIRATSFFRGLFNKRVRVAWSRQVEPDSWEAGLDFMKYTL